MGYENKMKKKKSGVDLDKEVHNTIKLITVILLQWILMVVVVIVMAMMIVEPKTEYEGHEMVILMKINHHHKEVIMQLFEDEDEYPGPKFRPTVL